MRAGEQRARVKAGGGVGDRERRRGRREIRRKRRTAPKGEKVRGDDGRRKE